ncbi:hypothetical protein Tco_0200719 [Tanacetum coccineum]
MADTRTMPHCFKAPTRGTEANLIPEIVANNSELKHGLDNLVQKQKFFRYDESFYEAWDRFNDLSRAGPHHDSLAGWKLLDKMLRMFKKLLESKSKVSQTRAKGVVARQERTTLCSSSAPALSKQLAELFVIVGGAHFIRNLSCHPGKFRDYSLAGTLLLTLEKEDLEGYHTESGVVAYLDPNTTFSREAHTDGDKGPSAPFVLQVDRQPPVPGIAPIHCVQRRRNDVVVNEENELIPTRLVYRDGGCCIDYQGIDLAIRFLRRVEVDKANSMSLHKYYPPTLKELGVSRRFRLGAFCWHRHVTFSLIRYAEDLDVKQIELHYDEKYYLLVDQAMLLHGNEVLRFFSLPEWTRRGTSWCPPHSQKDLLTLVSSGLLPSLKRLPYEFVKNIGASTLWARSLFRGNNVNSSGQSLFVKLGMRKYGELTVSHGLSHKTWQVEVSNRGGLKRILEGPLVKTVASLVGQIDDALWAFRKLTTKPIGCTLRRLCMERMPSSDRAELKPTG